MKDSLNMSALFLEFAVFGEHFQPENLSKALDLEPSSAWMKGEANNKNPKAPPRHECSWSYKIKASYPWFLDEITAEFLRIFQGRKEHLVKFIEQYALSCKFYVVFEIGHNDQPAIFLPHDFIKFTADVGACIDMDYYCFEDA